MTLNINTIRSCSLLLRNLGNPAFFNRFSSVDTLSFKTALSPFSCILSSFRRSDALRNSQTSEQQFSFGTITALNRCNFVFSGTRFFILGKIPTYTHFTPNDSFEYRIYSINRPGRLLNFWTLRVGAYSRWVLIRG